MPDLSGHDLLREWKKALDSVTFAAASLTGRPDLPQQMLAAMQRQLELVGELIEREQKLHREVAEQIIGPVDAVFDLLEQTGTALRGQAEALESASRAIAETAELMSGQAELFERTIGTLRRPAEMARGAAGLERRKDPGELIPPGG